MIIAVNPILDTFQLILHHFVAKELEVLRSFKGILSSCTSWGHVWVDDCKSFTVTVIRLTPVCVCLFCAEKHGLLVLKSTAKDSFIQSTFLQNNWQAWLLTNYQETCQQYSWWKVDSHATCHFFHPLSSLDPKKIHESKIRIILLEVVYFTMMMFWLSLHAARTHTYNIYIYMQTHLG